MDAGNHRGNGEGGRSMTKGPSEPDPRPVVAHAAGEYFGRGR